MYVNQFCYDVCNVKLVTSLLTAYIKDQMKQRVSTNHWVTDYTAKVWHNVNNVNMKLVYIFYHEFFGYEVILGPCNFRPYN